MICLTGEPGEYDEFGFSESADPEMFKCWIRDVVEWTDQSGEPDSRKREVGTDAFSCLLYTSPSPRDKRQSRMPSSA